MQANYEVGDLTFQTKAPGVFYHEKSHILLYCSLLVRNEKYTMLHACFSLYRYVYSPYNNLRRHTSDSTKAFNATLRNFSM